MKIVVSPKRLRADPAVVQVHIEQSVCSYDKGYDDIYMDGDYDWDRYNSDPDYADGVDDAMDEFDEEW